MWIPLDIALWITRAEDFWLLSGKPCVGKNTEDIGCSHVNRSFKYIPKLKDWTVKVSLTPLVSLVCSWNVKTSPAVLDFLTIYFHAKLFYFKSSPWHLCLWVKSKLNAPRGIKHWCFLSLNGRYLRLWRREWSFRAFREAVSCQTQTMRGALGDRVFLSNSVWEGV